MSCRHCRGTEGTREIEKRGGAGERGRGDDREGKEHVERKEGGRRWRRKREGRGKDRCITKRERDKRGGVEEGRERKR